MNINRVVLKDEIKLRRFMMEHDLLFALHSPVKNYYLSDSEVSGVYAVEENKKIYAAAFYSIMLEKNKSYIHYYMGDLNYLNDIKQKISPLSCQIFLKDDMIPGDKWKKSLSVTPGYVVDHPAYSGVFTRQAPRFSGSVYEHD